eukprot:862311-Lingulodinium_polyedra.AAC.1
MATDSSVCARGGCKDRDEAVDRDRDARWMQWASWQCDAEGAMRPHMTVDWSAWHDMDMDATRCIACHGHGCNGVPWRWMH